MWHLQGLLFRCNLYLPCYYMLIGWKDRTWKQSPLFQYQHYGNSHLYYTDQRSQNISNSTLAAHLGLEPTTMCKGFIYFLPTCMPLKVPIIYSTVVKEWMTDFLSTPLHIQHMGSWVRVNKLIIKNSFQIEHVKYKISCAYQAESKYAAILFCEIDRDCK